MQVNHIFILRYVLMTTPAWYLFYNQDSWLASLLNGGIFGYELIVTLISIIYFNGIKSQEEPDAELEEMFTEKMAKDYVWIKEERIGIMLYLAILGWHVQSYTMMAYTLFLIYETKVLRSYIRERFGF